jgi:hypothetical protein
MTNTIERNGKSNGIAELNPARYGKVLSAALSKVIETRAEFDRAVALMEELDRREVRRDSLSREELALGARHESGIAGSLWGGITYWLATGLFVACACASVGPASAPERPSATRPQDAILPHKRPSGLAYKYAQMPAVLRLNHAGLHFHVAHPLALRELLEQLVKVYD